MITNQIHQTNSSEAEFILNSLLAYTSILKRLQGEAYYSILDVMTEKNRARALNKDSLPRKALQT